MCHLYYYFADFSIRPKQRKQLDSMHECAYNEIDMPLRVGDKEAEAKGDCYPDEK
jgi:RNAse (barnase) inhibitor barstar